MKQPLQTSKEKKNKIIKTVHCPICQNEVLKDLQTDNKLSVGSVICNKCNAQLELLTEINYKLVKKLDK